MNKEIDIMDYGPALESSEIAFKWLSRHKNQFGHFINGKMTSPKETFKTINPSNLEVLAKISKGNFTDVDNAVKSAKQAFKSWKKTKPFERSKYLYALARFIQKNSRILAVLETLDNGKPIRETRDLDIPLVVRHFYYNAGWAKILEDKFPKKNPIGVIGQIIPWNFPLLNLAFKLGPELASGCPIIIRPSELSPISAYAVGEICSKIGLPPGVVQIFSSNSYDVADYLSSSKIPSLITLIGSSTTAKHVMQKGATSIKRYSMELGGNAPALVLYDADLALAANIITALKFSNAGQICVAPNRIFVDSKVYEDFKTHIVALAETTEVGFDKNLDIHTFKTLNNEIFGLSLNIISFDANLF